MSLCALVMIDFYYICMVSKDLEYFGAIMNGGGNGESKNRFRVFHKRRGRRFGGVDGEEAVSAGVLPVAEDPETGKIHVLLGQEAVGSRLWCDFGGGISAGTCSLVGAAREFTEETLGIFVRKALTSLTIDFISQRLIPDQPFRSMFGYAVPYDMYVIWVDFDPELPEVFRERRMAVMFTTACTTMAHIFPSHAFHASGCIHAQYLEKTEIAWVPLDNILNGLCEKPLRSEFADTILMYANKLKEHASYSPSCCIHPPAVAWAK